VLMMLLFLLLLPLLLLLLLLLLLPNLSRCAAKRRSSNRSLISLMGSSITSPPPHPGPDTYFHLVIATTTYGSASTFAEPFRRFVVVMTFIHLSVPLCSLVLRCDNVALHVVICG
jgi:uncharacterized protein YggT (Ycf19 family)